ncbi:MAG: hypothetical protein WDM84_01255 [Bauldia sp.]
MRALTAAALIAAALGAPVAFAADSAGPPAAVAPINPEKPVRLNRLFAALQVAPTAEAGKAIEQDILAEWLRSGDVEVDQLMASAIQQMDIGLPGLALAR